MGASKGLAEVLNEVLTTGDKIRVLAGDDKIDKGSFISAEDNFLVWADDDGNVLFTHLGDAVSVKKI